MNSFDFEALKQQVEFKASGQHQNELKFFETYDKNGKPHLLIYSEYPVPVSLRNTKKDVMVRYYHKTSSPLSFLGQFFAFISEGLDFAYIDSLGSIHVFVNDQFMSRAYGYKHNNIKALKVFTECDVHIYPSTESYRNQIRQAIYNRLILSRRLISIEDLRFVYDSQRGIFQSLDEVAALDVEDLEEQFHKEYDFDQSMSTYIVALNSEYIERLSSKLSDETEGKFVGIVRRFSEYLKLKISIYHIKQGNNNGEWERMHISLVDGSASVKFYEKPSLNNHRLKPEG